MSVIGTVIEASVSNSSQTFLILKNWPTYEGLSRELDQKHRETKRPDIITNS